MARSAKRDLEYCKLALRCTLFSEEIGSYRSLHAQIQAKNSRMLKCADREVREEYKALVSRVAEALAYEQRFGEGSLLNLNHSSVKELIRLGLISEEQLAAATARQEILRETGLVQDSAVFPRFIHPPSPRTKTTRRPLGDLELEKLRRH